MTGVVPRKNHNPLLALVWFCELSPILGDKRDQASILSLNFTPSTTFHLRQQGIAFETAPALFGGLGELEDHGECRLIREATLRARRPMPNGRKRAFDRVCGP